VVVTTVVAISIMRVAPIEKQQKHHLAHTAVAGPVAGGCMPCLVQLSSLVMMSRKVGVGMTTATAKVMRSTTSSSRGSTNTQGEASCLRGRATPSHPAVQGLPPIIVNNTSSNTITSSHPGVRILKPAGRGFNLGILLGRIGLVEILLDSLQRLQRETSRRRGQGPAPAQRAHRLSNFRAWQVVLRGWVQAVH
jgi:hypothetical protein